MPARLPWRGRSAIRTPIAIDCRGSARAGSAQCLDVVLLSPASLSARLYRSVGAKEEVDAMKAGRMACYMASVLSGRAPVGIAVATVSFDRYASVFPRSARHVRPHSLNAATPRGGGDTALVWMIAQAARFQAGRLVSLAS